MKRVPPKGKDREAYLKEREANIVKALDYAKKHEEIDSVCQLYGTEFVRKLSIPRQIFYDAMKPMQGLLIERRDKKLANRRKSVPQQWVKSLYRDGDHSKYKGEKNALEKIADRYSPEELKAIADGVRFTPGQTKVPIISFEGQRIRFLACSDPHFGSKQSAEQHWLQMIKEAKKEKVEFAVCCGDVTNGMDTQKAPHYEQDHIGFESQKKRAIEMLSLVPVKTYVIAGNHDLWYKKQNNAEIAPDICDAVKRCEYLGEHEGDISLKGNAIIKLFHGNDGASYALSYRLQKLIEALTGGEKPNILIAGHSHKALYIFERMVHALAAGAMQRQTQWMRTKRLASHTGFWIVDVWVNKAGVAKFQPCFYPFYS